MTKNEFVNELKKYSMAVERFIFLKTAYEWLSKEDKEELREEARTNELVGKDG